MMKSLFSLDDPARKMLDVVHDVAGEKSQKVQQQDGVDDALGCCRSVGLLCSRETRFNNG